LEYVTAIFRKLSFICNGVAGDWHGDRRTQAG
jgi:hypothetical protein